MPDGTRPYNPKSANSVKLEGFLNSVLGLKIVPATDTYLEDLSAGLEYFTQPKTFIKRECKIKVDYPYSMLHAEEVSQGKFKLVYGNGKELDDTTFPSRDAAEAHVQSLNAERDEGNLLRFAKFPEVLFINPPENPQGVPALDTQLEDIEDEEDEVPGW